MSKLHDAVTTKLVAMLESGVRPWQRPWSAGAPAGPALLRPLRSNGAPYRGANVLNLWMAGLMRGFSARHWMTYKGAQQLGGQVRKGARSELAFYVGQTTREAQTPEGEDTQITFLKAYTVFNAEEIDGLPSHFYAPAPIVAPADLPARNATVDAFVAATGAQIAHGGDRAYFMPSGDRIQMPHAQQFADMEGYYTVLLHELTHWTGTEARTGRTFGKRFGDDAYAVEELVAELGSAFLSADLQVSAQPREDHASYLASWLKILKADSRAIFTAAAAAEKAAAYCQGLQPQPMAQAA